MPTDYTNEGLTITKMVYNRLRFLEVNLENTQLIADFVWEVMNEIESCLQVGVIPDGQGYSDSYNASYLQAGDYYSVRVGREQNYSVAQRSLIADLVAVYILMTTSATNAQGSTGGTGLKFLKKAKAGTAEVEWGEFDLRKTGSIGFQGLIDMYRANAARRAREFGCILDICNDCTALQGALPFIVVSDCGCGC